MLISIVTPFHNEEECIPRFTRELAEAAGDLRHDVEALLVNDASTDRSGALLEEAARTHPFIRSLHLSRRGGQTGCFQAAFAEARGRYIIRMDGDLQDVPADLARFLPHLEAGADLVMGLREARRHRRILRVATHLYDLIITALFDSPFHSNSSSFIAFRAGLIQGIKLRPNDHRYLPLIALRRGATKLGEIVVTNRPRTSGRSKYGTFTKLALGLPEIVFFLIRLKRGYYDGPHALTPVSDP